jgi:probable O-glycosylation ligase (exosortase A-associated)
MRDILLVAIVISCAFLALRRPTFGILAFIGVSLVNPNSMTWGFARLFPSAQFIAIGTLLGFVFWNESKKLPLSSESILLIALWGIFGVSTVFAIYPDASLEKLIYISKILLMVFLSTILINSEHQLRLLLKVIGLSLGFYGLKSGFWAIVSGGQFMVWGPEESFLYSNNAIGLALSLNVPILFYLAKIETKIWLRRLMIVMMVLSYPAIICTFSRGAWLTLAAMTGLMALYSKRKALMVSGGGILAIVLLGSLATGLMPVPERVQTRYDQLVGWENEESAESRFWNWEFCKRVGLARPFGGGFNFYALELYPIYFPEFIDKYGTAKIWSCHSMWYTILGEHGVIGFILWILLILSCFLSLRKLRRWGNVNAWIIPYVNMVQFALIACMIAGTFLDTAYFDLFYQLVAIIIIMKSLKSRSAITQRSPFSPSSIEHRVPALQGQWKS